MDSSLGLERLLNNTGSKLDSVEKQLNSVRKSGTLPSTELNKKATITPVMAIFVEEQLALYRQTNAALENRVSFLESERRNSLKLQKTLQDELEFLRNNQFSSCDQTSLDASFRKLRQDFFREIDTLRSSNKTRELGVSDIDLFRRSVAVSVDHLREQISQDSTRSQEFFDALRNRIVALEVTVANLTRDIRELFNRSNYNVRPSNTTTNGTTFSSPHMFQLPSPSNNLRSVSASRSTAVYEPHVADNDRRSSPLRSSVYGAKSKQMSDKKYSSIGTALLKDDSSVSSEDSDGISLPQDNATYTAQKNSLINMPFSDTSDINLSDLSL